MPNHVLIDESKIRIQKKTQWCYAAIAQMVVEHYDKVLVPQSEIVRSVMASAPSPTEEEKKDGDNLPQDPYTYLHELHHIFSIVKDQAPDPYIIREEIDNGRPIIVRIGTAGSGHYMLIVGYSVHTSSSSNARGNTTSVSSVWYIDPLNKTYTKENGSDANSRVECEYEDSVTKKTNRGKDNITGYYLTAPKDVCEPRDIKAAEKEAARTKRAQDKKSAAASAATETEPHASPSSPKVPIGKPSIKRRTTGKNKKGGRRSRMRNPTRKCQKRKRTRTATWR